MSNKQTQCPECLTIYKVSVAQLTVAQGMVCCPKCNCHFNAVVHLIQRPSQTLDQDKLASEDIEPPISQKLKQQQVLDIFERKVEHSNIDLRTYLNNLNYFVQEPVTRFTNQTPPEKVAFPARKRSLRYYLFWTFINILLLMFLSVQMMISNPYFIQNSVALNKSYEVLCGWLGCISLDERYAQIKVQKLQISINQHHMAVSGELVNHFQSSLPLPILQFHFEDQTGQITTYNVTAAQYLDQNHQGIGRIPTQTPFMFSFIAELPENYFKKPVLEIIKP